MMLYVFHVDVGRMMTFDMTVALSSVENLKETIQRLHGIPAANIVLMVSGGEMLMKSTQVSTYSAGTDTNPIYMFLTGETKLPSCMPQSEAEVDLREQVDRCLELPPVYETVVKRAQLAQRIHEMARDEERLCERLVHEQHLQQQGWSAVVANIEDLTDEFRHRYCEYCASFDRHLEKRGKYLELLSNFGDDLTQLARIPILPGLMSLAEEDFHGFDEFLEIDEVFSRSHAQQQSVLMVGASASAVATVTTTAVTAETQGENANPISDSADVESGEDKAPNKKLKMGNEAAEECTTVSISTSQTSTTSTKRRHLNLLQWITSKENHNTLKEMCDECTQALSAFTEEIYEKLKIEWQNIVKLAEQGDVKEIKGLSDRLCRLEEFKYKIKSMVQDQKELSTAFQQNQNRAMNLRDPSILPDLCASHQSQLVVMLQNQQKIRDHRRCIARAKDELGANLHTRLKRIVFIENAMSELDNMLLFYRRCQQRAVRHINIIEQIHQAPSIYVAAVTEVVRRKIFSGEFRQWASKLAEDFDTIHSEEIKRRQLFNASFEGHFLNILFPGMSDMPPAFANENPLVFDTSLPNLTRADIGMLSTYLPDLAPQIQLPDMGPVINFFVSRSGAHQQERMEELLRQQMAAAMNADGAADNTLLRQAAVCEKVLISTQTMLVETVARSTTTDPLLMQSVETLTEETEQSTRAEVQRLRAQLDAMSKLSLDCICMARENLASIRADTQTYRDDLQSELQTLNEKWQVVRMQSESHAQQQQQQADAEHNCEMQLLRELLEKQAQELQALQQQMQQMAALETKCTSLQTEVEELRHKLQAAQQEKENAVTGAREELIHEHKTEIESLRCRFKLMTSMERTPSDASLERIERPTSADEHPDIMDVAQHEAIVAQLRATLEAENIKAINAAIEGERALNSESVMANVSILKQMLEEKERQLDMMREKDSMVTKENIQLKTRLDALINDDGNSWLKEKIEYLNRDKCRLEEELNMEKSRRLEMESSVKTSIYEQNFLPRSKSSGSSHKVVVLETCAKGDIVFVVWSVRHVQFMVVQDSLSLYFVHGDSLAGLNLRLPTQADAGAAVSDEIRIPMPYYAIGRVIEKEYCQAKKDENRYRVTKGSKFYRIKLAPLTSKQPRRERLESFFTSISRSVSQCESHSEPYAATAVSAAVAGSVGTLRQSQSMSSTSVAMTAPYARDVVDFAIAAPTIASVGISGGGGISGIGAGFNRTISIASVTEEDDEPVSLPVMIERYISVGEEETLAANDAMGADSAQTTAAAAANTKTLQQSVITEQPTASSKLILDLMLASADIQNQQCDATATTMAPNAILSKSTTTVASDRNDDNRSGSNTPQPTAQPTEFVATAPTAAISIQSIEGGNTVGEPCSVSIPASVGTTSEDSDEYRSLEAKEDADFLISE